MYEMAPFTLKCMYYIKRNLAEVRNERARINNRLRSGETDFFRSEIRAGSCIYLRL